MRAGLILTAVAAGCVWASTDAAEHDYCRYLAYPKKLVPGVGRDKVEQAGGPDAMGYKRRTVQWWPRKEQDIVDIPVGERPAAALRVWLNSAWNVRYVDRRGVLKELEILRIKG